jgi:hypothetical protein
LKDVVIVLVIVQYERIYHQALRDRFGDLKRISDSAKCSFVSEYEAFALLLLPPRHKRA